MEMIRYSSLSAIDIPIAEPIELVSEVGRNHSYVLVLQWVEVLVMAFWTCIYNDWAVALVTHQDRKFIFITFILLLNKLHDQIALIIAVSLKPLGFLL